MTKYINYKDPNLHKDDIDISIGNSTLDIMESLEGDDLLTFFESVKDYYMKACDYVVSQFPLQHEAVVNAQVADTFKQSSSSYSKIRYFTKKFPILVLKKIMRMKMMPWTR